MEQMNQMAEIYINKLATVKAQSLKEDSSDGEVFKLAREVANEAVEAGVTLDEDTTSKIYKALMEYKENLGQKEKRKKMQIKATYTVTKIYDVDLKNYPKGTKTSEDVIAVDQKGIMADPEMFFSDVDTEDLNLEVVEE